jgi:hypothetical protein
MNEFKIPSELDMFENVEFDKETEPGLTLTLTECKIFTKCPFSGIFASNKNYPGYNEVINKIYDFVNDNRKP